jgi:hypothetical protein
MKPAKEDPQAYGSVITYQRRYALGAILGLNIDEDDDGNKASVQSTYAEDQVIDEKPWMSTKERELLLDRIAHGQYVGKTADEVLTLALGSFKIRREFKEDIKAAMNTKAAQTTPANAESLEIVNRSIETIKKQKAAKEQSIEFPK